MNPAVVTATVQEQKGQVVATIRGVAKKVLILRRAGRKAARRVADRLADVEAGSRARNPVS